MQLNFTIHICIKRKEFFGMTNEEIVLLRNDSFHIRYEFLTWNFQITHYIGSCMGSKEHVLSNKISVFPKIAKRDSEKYLSVKVKGLQKVLGMVMSKSPKIIRGWNWSVHFCCILILKLTVDIHNWDRILSTIKTILTASVYIII